MREIVFFGDKGLPSKPTKEQEWAIIRLREYNYRQTFGLSKVEMNEEPLEDVVINEEIVRLFQDKSDRDSKKMKKHGRR